MLGRTSAGHVSSCRMCLGTGYFLQPQGVVPPGFTPFGGWVYCQVPEGNADGAVGIFCNAERVWALSCDRNHLKKALCHIRPVVGRMINTRSYSYVYIALQLLGRTSAGRVWSSYRSGRVCLGSRDFLRPQEAIPQVFIPFGGWVYCLAPKAPL